VALWVRVIVLPDRVSWTRTERNGRRLSGSAEASR
jgi:hypothetical protein